MSEIIEITKIYNYIYINNLFAANNLRSNLINMGKNGNENQV